jgi:hypothetical protein
MPEIDEKAENCRVAIRAAAEAVNEYCGAGKTGKQEPDVPTIRFLAGHDVPMDYIPEDIFHILDKSATTQIAVENLIEHEWVKDQAQTARHFAVPEDAPKELQDAYIEYAKKKIARTLEWARVAGTLETAKERAERIKKWAE